MRVYVCGQKYFGQAALTLVLEEGHTVCGVSAPAADVNGREDRLWRLAAREGLPVLPAGALNARTIPEGVDLLIAAHSHDFIGRATRLRLRYGALGYHPSLLPLHRGRDAVRWAIKLGERVTGGTVFWLSETVDGGPVAAQEHCFVPRGATADSLWRDLLAPMGIRLLRAALRDVARGVQVRIPQDHRIATWEPSLSPPRLYRPDLILLGDGSQSENVRVVVTQEENYGERARLAGH